MKQYGIVLKIFFMKLEQLNNKYRIWGNNKYIKPCLSVINFSLDDIITKSECTDCGGDCPPDNPPEFGKENLYTDSLDDNSYSN